MSNRIPIAAAFAAMLLAPTAVFAHAYPQKGIPPINGTVRVAPHDLSITFDDELEPKFTGVVVTDSKGVRVDLGNAHVPAGHAKELVVGLKPLTPGRYEVRWHATDTDTHKTHGSYYVTIAP
jgi:methionine-rich copper-binding protein CopC